jgi:hypothetical protein
VREVAIDGIAQIARHVFLERRTELAGDPHQNVLGDHRGEDDHDDVAQRRHFVTGDDRVPDGVVEQTGDPALFHPGRRLVKQDVEERNEQRDREAVEERGGEIANYRDRHAPPVGAQKGQKLVVDACRHYRRGVSSASGRITSSGVTPPCRNDPR